MKRKFLSAGVFAGVLIVVILASIFSFPLPGVKIQTVSASFTMVADEEDGSGVENDSSFTLKSSEDLDEDVIAEVLSLEPEVAFEVDRTGTGEYEINPEKALDGNKIYRFAIRSKEKNYTWAYQVKDTFKIKGTLPGDQSTTVPLASGIEINFSHENYEKLDKYFEVKPTLKGHFEYHRKTAVYVPEESLKEATVYTVKIDGDLPLKDSDQKLGEDFTFQFETDSSLVTEYDTGVQFRNSYYEIGTEQTIALKVYDYDDDGLMVIYDEGSTEDLIKIGDVDRPPDLRKLKNGVPVNVYRYKNLDEYLKAWEERAEIPSWCYWSRNLFSYSTKNLELLGTFEAQKNKIEWQDYIYFPDAQFEPGFYLFELKNGRFNRQAIVQITDLSAYITVTTTDTLVWINDVKTKKAAKAEIELIGLNKEFSTNTLGVSTFETPEEWKNEWKDRESFLMKFTDEKGKMLLAEITPEWWRDNSFDYWHGFYTDRPMYSGNDTMRYWGFIQPKKGTLKKEELKINIYKDWLNFVQQEPLVIDKNYNYSGAIGLKNLLPGYYYAEVLIGEGEDAEVIESKYFEIKNYVKPAYEIAVLADKEAVFAGEKMKFDIDAHFFEGTPVPALNLTLNYPNATAQNAKTDAEGKYSVEVTSKSSKCPEEDYWCGNSNVYYFEVKPHLGEETDEVSGYEDVRVFNSTLSVSGTAAAKDNVAKIDISTNFVDLKKLNEGTNEHYEDYLGEIAKNRKVQGKIIETTWIKTETGQYYDFINKKNVKTYDYTPVDKVLPGFEVVTDEDGKAAYEFTIDPEKKYRIVLTTYDDKGNEWVENVFVYGSLSDGNEYFYYHLEVLNGKEDEYKRTFDIGEKVEIVMKKNEMDMESPKDGAFLFLQYQDGLQQYEIISKPVYDFSFKNEDVPNVNVGAVMFDGQKYVSAYDVPIYYDSDLKSLNIEIESDKESYEPGEKAKLDIKVTDKDGDGVFANVNLNLVDEAYYKLVYEFVGSPLDDLYRLVPTGVLTSYESHDNPLSAEQDGGKGGCFLAGTQILMADGRPKNIEDVVVGDYILTKESYVSGELVPALVAKLYRENVSEYFVVNEKLRLTAEHIIFLNGRWQRAAKLKVGDVMLYKDGGEIEVASLRTVREEVTVYNFEVEKYHTYFADGFYVHNDKGGDGIRSDFEDNALFETVATDSGGNATIEFTLPDNITSWRVSAKAVNLDQLAGGSGEGSLKVSMPVFVDIVSNREFSVKDSPVLKFRAFGDALKKGDKVDFKLGGNLLGDGISGDGEPKVSGEAFLGSYYELPKLTLGDHEVTVFAKSGKYEDALLKKISVVDSRLSAMKIDFDEEVVNGEVLKVSNEVPSEIFFVDVGRSAYFWQLLGLYNEEGDRLDQRISELAAVDMAKKYFDKTWAVQRQFEVSDYQDASGGGLKILPYGSQDLRLSALAVMADVTPLRYDVFALKKYFYAVYEDKLSNLDDVVLSLLGLASLDEPVLTSLRAISEEEKLGAAEKLYIGLAFEKLGEDGEAAKIYEEVFANFGGKYDKEQAYEKALSAILAAGLGNKESVELWHESDFFGIEDDIMNLYRIGFLDNYFENVSFDKAKFTVEFGDESETFDLEKSYGAAGIYVFPGDKVRVSSLVGDLAALISYTESVDPKELKTDDGVSIKRSYYVNDKKTNEFKEGDIVKVRLDVGASGSVPSNSYMISDILPSGLTPVTQPDFYSIYNGYYTDSPINYPYYIDGQEVRFYWYSEGKPRFFQYYARVVNTGEFYADPAKIQSYYDDSVVNISEGEMVKIGRE
ncbi:Ig-like domain-containing protein [Candidatus Peregrinibacteria bacterium]|nr:Ig-like domain-containing protein [Candidatus Peregrinibacteria bacterium]